MQDKSIEVNFDSDILPNNYDVKSLSLINSNITGFSWKKIFNKKEKGKENNKIYNLKSLSDISLKTQNNFFKLPIYQSLSKKEKLKYIHNIIKKSMKKEPYDFFAVKRKKFTLSYLINQFDSPEKSKTIEKKNICKRPYPLLYCISNRKIGNDSSNLLSKILSSDNKQISKKQEKVIKNSEYSKIFNSNISDLIKTKIKSKNKFNLKSISNNFYNNLTNFSKTKISNGKKSPFLNKYINAKVNNYKYRLLNRNDVDKYSSVGFFSDKRRKNSNKTMKKWKSTFSLNINNNEYNSSSNNIESFKNKTVYLNNHNNNFINYSIINERNKKIIDDIFDRKRKNNSETKFDDIIKDVSHLKFNNQIMPFKINIKEL